MGPSKPNSKLESIRMPTRNGLRAVLSSCSREFSILSSYLYQGLNVLLFYGLVPVYVILLGDGGWGAVGIATTVVSVFFLLDAGLGQFIPRDFAAADSRQRYIVWKYYCRHYQRVGIIGVLLIQIAAPFVVSLWLKPGVARESELAWVIRLASICAFFQFANSVAVGYWVGTNRFLDVSKRILLFSFMRHGVALLSMKYIRADAWVYLAIWIIIAAVEAIYNKRLVDLEMECIARKDVSARSHSGAKSGMSMAAFAVLIGIAALQIDKVVLSSVLKLEDYGRYVIFSNLGMTLLMLQQPINRAYLPSIVRSLTADPSELLRTLRRHALAVVAFCAVPLTLFCCAVPTFLEIWFRGRVFSISEILTLRLIIVGCILNSLYQAPYQVLIGKRIIRDIFLVNSCVFLIICVSAALLASKLGIVFGGLSWAIGAAVQLGIGLGLVLKYLPRDTGLQIREGGLGG